jgi:hypothetical protein
MMDTITALDLLVPRKLDGFCGNKYVIKCIEEYIKKKDKEECIKNIVCLLGPDGCGKTTLCRLIFKKYNYNVLEVGKDNLGAEDIKTLLNNFAKNNTIDSLMNKRPKVVFVDDIDILVNIDKLVLSKITCLNKLFIDKGVKVFLTCNVNDEKKINDHVKDIQPFKLNYPLYKDSYVYIMNMFDSNGVTDYEPEELLEVALKCKGNIRDIVLNLHTPKETLENKQCERVFKDMNNFEVTKHILHKKAMWKDVEVLCKGDVGITSHLLYENLPDEVETNFKVKRANKTYFLDMYLKVNKHFIDASKLEEQAFTSHDWNLLGYANYLKMHSVQNGLETLERKSSTKDIPYKFSQMISKMSHKNIMNKKVKNISNVSNVSNNCVIMASDMHASMCLKDEPKRKSSKGGKGKKSANSRELSSSFNFEEGETIVNTYQKYFT